MSQPFPEGTLVCLKTGGPMMTVEDTTDGNLVATVWFVAGVVYRDAFHPAHLNAFVPATAEQITEGESASSVLQDDLRDMCRALGLPDGARPESPHEVFRECIAAVLRRQNLPCPICNGVEGCDHTVPERRDAAMAAKIKYMVNRFLGWKLPENLNPDGGISFQKFSNLGTDYQHKYEPSGTNILDATQADAMVRYMIAGMPNK